ncbi:MAG: thiamine diphosphokinase [Rhizobiaceae bacterium]
MNDFAILLDGEMTATPRLKAQLEGRRVIAADGGIRHAEALDVDPELWLGDFDSAPSNVPARYAGLARQSYPRDKDLTDGEIAVNAALASGATKLLLVGAFGGRRADHALLHKLLAMRLAGDGIAVLLSDGMQEGRPILPGRHEFDLPQNTVFSLIGFAALSGLSITGAKWPLDNVEVALGSSLTLSNEVAGRLAVTLEKGQALMIVQTGTG